MYITKGLFRYMVGAGGKSRQGQPLGGSTGAKVPKSTSPCKCRQQEDGRRLWALETNPIKGWTCRGAEKGPDSATQVVCEGNQWALTMKNDGI